jgi:hypothetical protein
VEEPASAFAVGELSAGHWEMLRVFLQQSRSVLAVVNWRLIVQYSFR